MSDKLGCSLNTTDWREQIERSAFAARWEISGMAWKAAADIGCLDEFIHVSTMAWMRREIINMFADNAFFARRGRI